MWPKYSISSLQSECEGSRAPIQRGLGRGISQLLHDIILHPGGLVSSDGYRMSCFKICSFGFHFV